MKSYCCVEDPGRVVVEADDEAGHDVDAVLVDACARDVEHVLAQCSAVFLRLPQARLVAATRCR